MRDLLRVLRVVAGDDPDAPMPVAEGSPCVTSQKSLLASSAARSFALISSPSPSSDVGNIVPIQSVASSAISSWTART